MTTAVVIDRRIERRLWVNVREVRSDPLDINEPPRGFHRIAATRRFTVWGSCRS